MLLTGYQRTLQRLLISCCVFCVLTVYYLLRSEVKVHVRALQPISAHRLYPSNWSLIDRTKFDFLLNSDVCSSSSSRRSAVRLLIVVTSHPGHVTLRRAFRKVLPASLLETHGIRRVFLLARIDPLQKDYAQINQSTVENEHLSDRDVVQGDFLESYHHLSYKHIMGLKYAVHYCSQTQWIVKMDDDIAVDIFQLLDYLENSVVDTHDGLVIVGAVMNGSELDPLRRKNSKWDVTYDEYALEKYPPFVSGWAYATTVAAAHRIVHYSQSSPFFWIDDVFVTGLLADLSGIQHVDIRSKLTVYQDHVKCCIQQKPRSACRYIIAPVVDAFLLERFYRHVLKCWLEQCPLSNHPCVIVNNSPMDLLDVPNITGQVIPIYK